MKKELFQFLNNIKKKKIIEPTTTHALKVMKILEAIDKKN